MANRNYKPSAAGGELQLKDGSSWEPILGINAFSVTGGDRETSSFETLDGGVESSFGGAQPKDISITLNPSFMSKGWRDILTDAYYGDDNVTIRYRTLAAKNAVLTNATAADTIAIATSGALTFASGADDVIDAAIDQEELGLLIAAQASGITQTDETNLGNLFILDADRDTVRKYNDASITQVAASQHWKLIRYGIAFEYECRVVSGANPELAVNAPIADTLSLRQVSAAMKIYPIIQAAS